MVQLSHLYMTTGKIIALICNIFLMKKALAPLLNYDQQFVSDQIKNAAAGWCRSKLSIVSNLASSHFTDASSGSVSLIDCLGFS